MIQLKSSLSILVHLKLLVYQNIFMCISEWTTLYGLKQHTRLFISTINKKQSTVLNQVKCLSEIKIWTEQCTKFNFLTPYIIPCEWQCKIKNSEKNLLNDRPLWDSPTLRIHKPKHKVLVALNVQLSAISDALLPSLMTLITKHADKRAMLISKLKYL